MAQTVSIPVASHPSFGRKRFGLYGHESAQGVAKWCTWASGITRRPDKVCLHPRSRARHLPACAMASPAPVLHPAPSVICTMRVHARIRLYVPAIYHGTARYPTSWQVATLCNTLVTASRKLEVVCPGKCKQMRHVGCEDASLCACRVCTSGPAWYVSGC